MHAATWSTYGTRCYVNEMIFFQVAALSVFLKPFQMRALAQIRQ